MKPGRKNAQKITRYASKDFHHHGRKDQTSPKKQIQDYGSERHPAEDYYPEFMPK